MEAVSRIILWVFDRVGVVKKAHPLEGNGSCIQNYIIATWPSWGVIFLLLDRGGVLKNSSSFRGEWKLYPEWYFSWRQAEWAPPRDWGAGRRRRGDTPPPPPPALCAGYYRCLERRIGRIGRPSPVKKGQEKKRKEEWKDTEAWKIFVFRKKN